MYWVGMDTDPRTTPEALAEFNRFYSTTHVAEVVAAHPGFVAATRYELIDQDARGGEHRGPRWLAVYDMADQRAAEQYIKDNERPWLHRRKYSPWPAARKRAKTVWRMIWREISSGGARDRAPETVVAVGTNVALSDDLGGGENVIVARYELYRAFAHPSPGCPRFCTIFEGASAPPTRDNEQTVWRLVYRRTPAPN